MPAPIFTGTFYVHVAVKYLTLILMSQNPIYQKALIPTPKKYFSQGLAVPVHKVNNNYIYILKRR